MITWRRGLNETARSEIAFRIFKCQLVNVSNLVRVHEARLHIMLQRLVRSTNQHRRVKLDVRRSVTMHVFIFGGAEVTTKEQRLDALEKRRIGRHHIFKLAVLRTVLAHHDLAVVFNDLGLDFTRMLVHQSRVRLRR